MRYYEKKHPGKKKEMSPETENIILKEKVSMLIEQRDKLKAAVASLACLCSCLLHKVFSINRNNPQNFLGSFFSV